MTNDREIERRFLLAKPSSEILADAVRDGTLMRCLMIHQSYLPDTGRWTIRARMTISSDGSAALYEETKKLSLGPIEDVELPTAITRAEYDAMLRHCGPILCKRRAEIRHEGMKWEIDTFLNPSLAGLETVEVELPHAEFRLKTPSWVGEEVSHLGRYRSRSLAATLPETDRRPVEE